ncbi:MAG: SLC13 family permease [Candidatus Electrothrix communis]|nr:anion permease [Desulfobulbus sp. US4]WLE95442.1 MAG: SLC13 family permease [Candidatus Electrothrix communis]
MSSNNKISLRFVFVVFSLVGAVALLKFSSYCSSVPAKAAVLALLTLVFWATALIPEHLTALLFFLLAMVFSLAGPEVIFAGFGSAAIWLIFGGLVIGIAISSTGLGARIARFAAIWLHGSYLKIISGLVAAGLLFSFLMPSAMGRVVLLTPIALSLADHFGFKEGSKGRTGVLLAIILGTYIPAFGILPANVPNMVLVGMAETQYHLSILYGSYLFLHFPLLSFVKAVLIIALILFFFPDQPKELPELPEQGEQAAVKFSRNELILSLVLAGMLGLWITDFLHHVSPAWVALGGALILLMPGVDIVGKKAFNQKVNWGAIIFVAGILGVGGMINHTGLGRIIAAGITDLLPLGEHQDFINYMSISLASAVTGMLTTLPAVPAVLTPLSDSLAQATGLPIQTLLMMQVVGFSTIMLPYQAPPIVVGMQLSGEKLLDAAKICLSLALVTGFILLPLNFFWWKLLDWL